MGPCEMSQLPMASKFGSSIAPSSAASQINLGPFWDLLIRLDWLENDVTRSVLLRTYDYDAGFTIKFFKIILEFSLGLPSS
jgi:hypothetical protein